MDIGIVAPEEIIKEDRFYWLDTNFTYEVISFRENNMDAYFQVEEADRGGLWIDGNTIKTRGNFHTWYRKTADKRFTLFGNLGLFSTWVLRSIEERKEGITFHACALRKEDRLLIVSGGAGSGKTVFILSALERGWRVFATEFVHLQIKKNVQFYRGALKDAVRVDTFRHHFPHLAEKLGLDLKEETGDKLVVDFSLFKVEEKVLKDPRIVFIFPHVEEKRERIIYRELRDRESILRNLFQNASEKLGKSLLLYGCWAVPGLDTPVLAEKRMERLMKLLEKGKVEKTLVWVSGVKEVSEIVQKMEGGEKDGKSF